MSGSKLRTLDVRLALVFVASQVGVWTGCNAILGNGYGAFDESAVDGPSSEGGAEGDALAGGEGGPGGDAMTLGDGKVGDGSNVLDGSVDGGSCVRGICPVPLTAAVGAQRIALGTTSFVDYVYWVSAKSLGRAAIDGSTSTKLDLDTLIASSVKRGVVVTTTGVPFVTVPARGSSQCTLNLTACTTGFIGSAGTSSSIAADASHIYVGISDSGAGHGTIYRSSDLSGSTNAAYTMTDQVFDLQIVGSNTFYRTTDSIKRITPATQASVAASLAVPPVAFSISGTKMVIATTNQLLTCPLDAAGDCTAMPAVVYVTSMAGVISAVAFDGTQILWAEGGSAGSIHRCDFPTCANSEVLAEGQASPDDLAVDSTSIYWANYGDATGLGGAIMKLAK